MKASPQGTRKSKRLDKGTPPSTPPVKRTPPSTPPVKGTQPSTSTVRGTPLSTPPVKGKSERVGKYNTPSPLRRSDRGKKDLSSGSLGAKQSPKKHTSSESKRKKEKNLIQVTMESKRVDQEEVGLKRKNMSGRKFRGQFKKQCILETESDAGEELERSEELFDVCTDNSRGTGSGRMGMVGKLRDGVGRASNGALEESVSTLQDCPEEVNNEIHVHSNLRDDAVNSKYPHTSSSARDMFDNPERLPKNCSASESMDVSESDGSVSLHGPKVAEATTSPSSMCGNYNLLGTCALCSKSRRLGYDSLEQELCSCSPTVDEDLGCCTTHKDKSDLGAAVTSDSQRDGRQNACVLCNKYGELLCCVGKGCKRCYHLCCLDPSLTETLPGVWHCPQCVKKKLLFGVHSVSEGVESIWDVREVDVSNAKGVGQKQYLVKYHGLAHIHNHWVPENQLLLENPCLVSNFIGKNKSVRWSTDWTAPHRLLARRSMQDKIYIASSAEIRVCDYEWLVKWRGLDYDNATWELDNSNFLGSSLGQNLIKSYEVRREIAKQEINKPYPGFIVKLPELPACRSLNENHVLKNVNKLCECLFKCLNGVVFDDQERVMTVIFSIQSMSEFCWPFLVVTAPGLLSLWEAEFAQLVPSLDVVVYGGSKDIRKGIRASEFYDEEGRMMVRVLLSSMDVVSEDLEILRSIKWKAVVIDDCQQFVISNELEQIKILSMDSTILLVNGQIKDTTSEYVKILSLLGPHGDFDKLVGLKPETNDNICKLKDRLSRFIAYGRTSQASKFIEYWIPVQISKFQLEHYCSVLLSNSISLCSCSRNDSIGVLQDILLTVRKCCSHPYLLDSSEQERLITEGCQAAEVLDVGIKACGKLELLDVMLSEIKARDLKVLIIFQLMGSVGSSTGDILDDFLRQRFGPSTYERVDAGINPSKKQAAVNRFNKKETGQFVFLLENRACSSTIKLSPVDVVVIYDSDWNPSTDLRALQKISIDSKVEQIKVLRLYSSFTIEEKALILAKQNLNLDNHLQNVSRATSETLLSWGATYLFNKLDEYHADSESNSAVDLSSEQQFLDKVTKEFQSILSDNYENTNPNSIISEAKLGAGSYSTNIPVLGEAKVKLKDGEEPHVFWKKLFEGKDPKWKHLNLKGRSPRSRKRVRYWEGATSGSLIGKDDTAKKRKKLVNENLVPASAQVESGSCQTTPVVAPSGGLTHDTRTGSPGLSTIKVCNQLGAAEVSVDTISDDTVVLSDEQRSLHTFLQGEMARLCQTLKLSEDVTHVARNFLEYVMKNHHVSSDSPSIVQAFQLSLCWAAASITKQKVEKKDTIVLAKQLLNYQCTEEQTVSVYSKMRPLKKMYLQSADNVTDSDRDYMIAEDGTKKLRLDTEGKTGNEEHAEGQMLVQQNLALKDKTAASETDKNIMRIQRKCDKRMKKLVKKHQQELQEFQEIWEGRREELEKDHKLESAFIRSIHSQGQVGFDKIKLLEDRFAEKMQEHNLLKDVKLKELKAKQLSAVDEERRKAADWIAKTKAYFIEFEKINGQQLLNSQFDDNAEFPQPRTSVNTVASGDLIPISAQHVGSENPSKRFCTRGNDSVPSSSSISVPAEAIVCKAPVENIVTTNSQSEAGVSEDIRSVGAIEELEVPNQMVQKDKTGRSLGSAQPQESDAPAVENESTPQIELATLEPLDSGTSVPSDLETPIIDEIVTPVASSHDDPVNANSGHLHNSSVGASISCNQAPATENRDQGRSSSQTAEHMGAEVLSHEPISQSEETLEIHSDRLDIGPSVDAAHGHSVDSSAILQNDVAIPQAVLSPSEQSNRAVPQLDINVGNLHRSFLGHPTRQHTATNSAPPLLTDPLQNELERIHKETAQLDKSREDMVSQLKSDCDKEIEELISQIRKKYELKHQETEAVFRLKRNELDKNRDKVLRNKILAEAFRSKCLDLRPSGVPGVPSNFTQQLHQSPLLPPNRHSPGPSGSQPSLAGSPGSQPGRTGPSGSQPARPMQLQARVHPSRSVPVAIQSVAPPSVAARPVHSALGAPPASRPLVINAISPAAANPRVSANELRSTPPHLQPFRPSSTPPATSPSMLPHLQPLRPPAPSPTPPATSPSIPPLVQPLRPSATSPSVSQLQPTPSQPAPLARAPQPSIPNSVTEGRAELQRVMLLPPNPSSTMQGLLMAMERRPSSSAPEHPPTLLPEISSTFSALELSDLEVLGSVQGNPTSAVATNVVCLSDDDN
ncbi:hypothetical protein ACS0TY_014613 [Phlomoides rotata]